MGNLEYVYDIRQKEKLMYVLSKDVTAFDLKDELASSIAVAVNLYYEEMSDFFFSYLTAIPDQINSILFRPTYWFWMRHLLFSRGKRMQSYWKRIIEDGISVHC